MSSSQVAHPLTPQGDPSRPAVGQGTTSRGKLLFILLAAFVSASAADHVFASAISFFRPSAEFAYRRVGPTSGPQVFVAGSSLLQFALSWAEISEALDQGMQSWGVPGSSPEVWEVSQNLATDTNLMIVGISLYDLNEYHLAEARAHIVSVAQTIQDLRNSGAGWQFSRRLLGQYLQAYVRIFFPTAGNSDAVLVGVRRLAREALGLASSSEDRNRALVLPSDATMEFKPGAERLSDLGEGRILRRLSTLRNENKGMHSFDGPKRRAFNRMLLRAKENGSVIIVVLPVSDLYYHAFITPNVAKDFENVLTEAHGLVPDVVVIRLDRVAGIGSSDNFSDLVHLNGQGQTIATSNFLKQIESFRSQAHAN